jgi:hypothetical protein
MAFIHKQIQCVGIEIFMDADFRRGPSPTQNSGVKSRYLVPIAIDTFWRYKGWDTRLKTGGRGMPKTRWRKHAKDARKKACIIDSLTDGEHCDLWGAQIELVYCKMK